MPATLQDSWEQASQLIELFGLLSSPVGHKTTTTSTIIQEPQHWPCATEDPEETEEQGPESRGVHLARPSQNAVLITSHSWLPLPTEGSAGKKQRCWKVHVVPG